MKLFKLLIFLILIIITIQVSAQTGNIRGFVYDKENGEPVIFTNVYLKGTTHGVATDVNGFYNISKIPVGKYILMVTYIGYDTLKVPIEISASSITNKKLFLTQSSINLDEFTVSAERQDMKTSVYTSIIKITPKQINKIPSIGTEPDLAQYLQILPGVIFTGDQGGQLYIRGGSPIQNKVLLDGMVVYNPFHSIGLFSVFDADIIRNADIFTGGFNAQYGGRISSIMDITTRDGNKKKLAGKFSASTFGSKLMIEGPIKKITEDDIGSSSFIFSGKTSYLEQSSKILYSYIDENGLPFNFTDLFGKLSFNAGNGSKLNIFGFSFSDKVNYQQVSNLSWNSKGIGTNIIVIPVGSMVLMKPNISFSNYNIELEEADNKPRSSSINNFNVGLSFVYFMGNNELDYGIEILGFTTDFIFYNTSDLKISQKENTTEFAFFGKYKFNLGNILLEPGIRTQYYSSLSNLSLEPRFGIKYIINDRLRIKSSAGLYSQNLVAANSDRDVVNLFYGFLSGPENIQDEFDNKTVKHKLQKSAHYIAGVEYDFSNRLNLNVEGYLKKNLQLTNINKKKIYPDNKDFASKPDFQKKDFIIEKGDAYGFDILLKYDFRRTYIWFVYSLGYVNRFSEDEGDNNEIILKKYTPHFDRRHNLNFVASYTFGKNLNWEISSRWNLGSGFPFTQTKGFYENLIFEDGPSTDYTTINGDLGIIYDDVNGGRLPYYHRLDITIKRKFEFGNNSTLETMISITNVYDRQNIFYFDRIKYERVDQLPFLPSVGLNLSF